jgi:molybdopterin/thiamine biosynthesis adenylyltransferase
MLPLNKRFVDEVLNNTKNLHEPVIFKLSNNSDLVALNDFLRAHPEVEKIDHFSHQVAELIKSRHPHLKLSTEELEQKTIAFYQGELGDFCGNWCYFSWNKKLVHILSEDDFIEVRTNRNKLKITREEQTLLKQKTIGVIGLSVGQAIAITGVMERICGKIKLADFDTIDLSNLNRLRTGIQNINKPKVIIAAQEIAEIDPYIKVEIHKEGITSTNIDEFISTLDVLIEVCDDFTTKVNSRFKARALKIPVVMDTNDRGMIDIERFDLEPNRPLFHGLIAEEKLHNLEQLNPTEKLGLILQLVSIQNTSPRLQQSMGEIGKTINTWPQLASSIMLGAGATIDICRKILLNEPIPSGRFYIDLDELIHQQPTSFTLNNGKN